MLRRSMSSWLEASKKKKKNNYSDQTTDLGDLGQIVK